MTTKKILIHIPSALSDVRVYKLIDLDDENTMEIEIEEYNAGCSGDKCEQIFCCNQDKRKVSFNPMEYMYIESTSNHYSLWHPAKESQPVLSIYTQSLGGIIGKLHNAGLRNFLRVHDSFIINLHFFHLFNHEFIQLSNNGTLIPIGREYHDDFMKSVTVI